MTYSSRVFAAAIFALATLSLAACSSNLKPAEDDSAASEGEGSLFAAVDDYSRSALEIPPDLLQSAGEKVRDNAAAADGSATGGAGGEDVLPEIIGAEIQSDDEKSWLEIDAEADAVWKKLTEFWALQEIDLVEYQPKAGIMETDWFTRKGNREGKQGFGAVAAELFNALVSRQTSADKFTLRLERDGAARTRIFVTHRAREKIARELKDIDKTVEFAWVEREQDPEKIAQLLQTIVLLFDSSAEPA